jgi:hypothetical protein
MRLIATTDDEIRAIMGGTDPNGAGNLGLLLDQSPAGAWRTQFTSDTLPVTRLRVVQGISRLIDHDDRSF